jgi:hypothetical protein
LHGHALLSAEEIDQAREMGLRPIVREGGHLFPLPCPLYQGVGAGCPTYRYRPAVCQTHQCELLGEYLEGVINLAEAMAIVDEIKGLLRSIHGRIGGGDQSKRIWDQVDEYEDGTDEGDETFRLSHVELLMELATLRSLCWRHFNPRGLTTK